MPETNILPEENKGESPQVSNLNTCSVESIEAELVRMHQSAAQEITAEEVELHQSIALDVTTASMTSHETALGVVSTKDAQMINSAAGAIRADNVALTGQVGLVMAGSANLGNTYAGLVAGREVRGERIETLILLGNRIEGNVQTVVDTRGALLAGLTGGLVTGLMLLMGRLMFRRRS